jgi:hypothetical protein
MDAIRFAGSDPPLRVITDLIGADRHLCYVRYRSGSFIRRAGDEFRQVLSDRSIVRAVKIIDGDVSLYLVVLNEAPPTPAHLTAPMLAGGDVVEARRP